jgi:acyl carrier protein
MNPNAFEVVKTVVHELSEELGYDSFADAGPDTPLYGDATGIDSLSLVLIVAAVERAAESTFDKRVLLADERAMSRRNSPYRTLGTLADLLRERLAE